MTENIAGFAIWLVCVWGCAALFTGIGIYAGKSKNPMHFWSGTRVNPRAVSDIPAYNRENKKMWILYSIPFWGCGILYYFSEMLAVVILMLASTLGIIWLIWMYHKIEKKYVNSLFNTTDFSGEEQEKNKKAARFSIAFTVIILLFCGVIMFTGKVEAVITEDALQMDATYWGKTTLTWDEITAVSLEENFASGSKSGGFNSAKLELGRYSNLQCGYYLLYRYIGCKSCVLMTTDEGYVAVNLKTEQETKKLYQKILEKTSN